MKHRARKYALIILFLLPGLGAIGQGHIFSRVNVNQAAVYVGQPVEVTVSVFTPTWFTSGVDPGNIKVNGAFTIYFRSVSSTERINGKTYAGVNMTFNVFPYEDGNVVFPSLEIKVESPDEGSSKGIRRLVKTTSKNIAVKPVPPSYSMDDWLVSSGVSVRDRWSGDRGSVRVGDVLERTIFREVQGSVAELIPPITWDSVKGVSTYPSRADVKNNKTRTSISATRTDGIKYLFEEEGEIEIPEITVMWWNPGSGTMQKRTLKKVTISVAPNPDLGMLKSIRDSLSLVKATLEEEELQAEKTSILGLSPWQLVGLVLILLLVIWLSARIYTPLKKAFLKQREQYKNSEKYYFRKYLKAAKQKNGSLAQQALYRWIDQLHLQEPSLAYFQEHYGNSDLLDSPENIFNVTEWSGARKNYIHGKRKDDPRPESWINP